MSHARRRYDPEFRAGAVRIVRDTRRPVVEIARDLGIGAGTLGNWVYELLDEHGTTLRDEPGIGPIPAATLLCEVGDPHRFDRESKFARCSGTGAVALSSGEGAGNPIKHRLDFRGNRRITSVLYIAWVTQQRSQPDAAAHLARKATEAKTRREARRAHKRQLANRIIRRMSRDEAARQQPHAPAA